MHAAAHERPRLRTRSCFSFELALILLMRAEMGRRNQGSPEINCKYDSLVIKEQHIQEQLIIQRCQGQPGVLYLHIEEHQLRRLLSGVLNFHVLAMRRRDVHAVALAQLVSSAYGTGSIPTTKFC